VSIFQEPLRGHGYVIGADVAEGLEHGDYSCGMVLDVETGLLVATWHDKTDPDLFGEQLAILGRFYNTALIGVEINNHGHVTVTALRRIGYPRIFRRRQVGQITEGFAPQYGWHTNRVSKPKMIEGLNTALREGTLGIRCEYTLAELRTYVREYTQGGTVRMHGSPHDDRVMALAIAVQMLDYTFVEHEEEKRDDRWTLDWWLRQANADPANDNNIKPIGAFNTRRVGHL
jgi:hypothetical protein